MVANGRLCGANDGEATLEGVRLTFHRAETRHMIVVLASEAAHDLDDVRKPHRSGS